MSNKWTPGQRLNSAAEALCALAGGAKLSFPGWEDHEYLSLDEGFLCLEDGEIYTDNLEGFHIYTPPKRTQGVNGMNFKVGDIVKTRDGREVEILCVDAPNEQPVVGIFLYNGQSRNWHADGRYYVALCGESNGDLTPPKRMRETRVWINVYPEGETFHSTEEGATGNAGSRALAVAVPVTVKAEW